MWKYVKLAHYICVCSVMHTFDESKMGTTAVMETTLTNTAHKKKK